MEIKVDWSLFFCNKKGRAVQTDKMKAATLVVPIAVFSTLVFFYIGETDAIKCYVCQDCAESYVSEHLQNCSRTVDKCIVSLCISILSFPFKNWFIFPFPSPKVAK